MSHAPLVETIRRELLREHPDAPGGTAIVAWSGGPDSTVLLDAMEQLAVELDLALLAVHVDHRLRDGSERDAAFCRRVAAARGIPLRVRRLEPPPDSLDHRAVRIRRYALLADEADRIGADLVATGHHARDVVETALLHFARGTGSEGMGSLMRPDDVSPPPVDHWPDVTLVRPLRRIAPGTIERYADDRGLDSIEDPTNTADSDVRFRLRRSVLDELAEGAGSLDSMLDSVENLADEATDRRRRARRRFDRLQTGPSARERVVLRVPEFSTLAPSLGVAVLEEGLRRLPGDVGWNRDHLVDVVAAAQRADEPEAELPIRITMRSAVASVDGQRLVLERTDGRGAGRTSDRRAEPARIRIDREGRLPWFDHVLEWRLVEPDGTDTFPTDVETAWLDRSVLPEELVVRSPRPGETFRALGGTSATPVAEVLRGADVPPTARWCWPLLATPPADRGDCLWVAGARQAHSTRVDDPTRAVVEFELTRRE